MSGSSSIDSPGARGPQGFDGAIGPVGSTGNKGNTGNCGVTGATGNFLESVSFSPLYYNSTPPIITDIVVEYTVIATTNTPTDANLLKGNTLFDGSGIRGKTLGAINIFAGITTSGILGSGSTATFVFKDIVSTTSVISVTSDSNFININSDSSTQVVIGTTWENQLAYIAGITQVGSSYIGFTSDSVSNNYLYFNRLLGSTLNHNALNVETKNVNVPSVTRTAATETYLDIRLGGMFIINTPIGIHGFTGMSGLSGATGEILSATLFFTSDDVWHFPQNIWFDSTQAWLTPGKNILNVYSTNNGASWTANFFARGYDADPNSIPGYILGSCCGEHNIGCVEYMSQPECINRGLTFTWCPLVSKTENTSGITLQHSCCMNGKCKDNVMYDMCVKYGGRTSPYKCSYRTCFNPCGPLTSCCVGGTCHNGYTRDECVGIFGTDGTQVIPGLSGVLGGGETFSGVTCSCDSTCSGTSTCGSVPPPDPYVGPTGPCCYINNNNIITCDALNSTDCAGVNGIYHGVGTCTPFNCECYAPSDFTNALAAPPNSSTETPGGEGIVKVYLTPTEYMCVHIIDNNENLISLEGCD